jgi:hypothetical protein
MRTNTDDIIIATNRGWATYRRPDGSLYFAALPEPYEVKQDEWVKTSMGWENRDIPGIYHSYRPES